ncbi:MAG: YidC/Oxa1 family membrane protein insertase [Treponema sp.]|nr:YidC/Oxa1 family membrane protein insertase [Treponema sp.]
MLDILYTIIIFPLVQIIELSYLFVYRVSHNSGIALFGVSIAVSVLTLPLYLRAEKWQETERKIQKHLAPKIAKIKAVFSGDEQYMLLSTYYRQNHYHPVYALRNTFGLFIQLPFFIAAYSYLSHLEAIQGVSFLFVNDLGAPDMLINVRGGYNLNILPLIMTLVNCISSSIYTKGLALKDKIQLYGMALVFLMLLYNSPSGLVLYWTVNNIFSLLKNILVKTKYTKQLVYGILFTAAACLDVYVLFFHSGDLPNRLLACGIFSCVFFIPLFIKIPSAAAYKFGYKSITKDIPYTRRCFILSSLIILLLAGLVIPGSLIASSVEEFSFIENYRSPFPFIFHTMLQAMGISLFWSISIYLLFSPRIQQCLSIFMIILSLWALINVFLVSENFGFLTNTLIFSDPKFFTAGNIKSYLINMAILAVSTIFVLYLILMGKKMLLFSFQIIVLVSLLCFGIVTIAKIQSEYTMLQDRQDTDNANTAITSYSFSKTGKNVLLIMLDAAVSGYVPYIFEEKPELVSSFKDFTWYPNCVSFANHTLIGAPPIYGGYEYTPEEINRRDSVPLVEKHKEAYLLLPLLFSKMDYSVTVTDPPFSNYRMSKLSIFADYPQIHADNIIGKYTSHWLNAYPDKQNLQSVSISRLLQNNLIRFSVFKTAPLFLRFFIYDDGDWLGTANLRGGNKSKNRLTKVFIDNYAHMDLLPQLTGITHTGNTYTAIYTPLTHEPILLQVPDYIPYSNITNQGNGRFADDSYYHVNMASFLLLEKFFLFLKDEGVYDNSRIILVADHGRGSGNYENNILLPDGSYLQLYNPLLMVKDFKREYSEDSLTDDHLKIDNSFMTNADIVSFALKDIAVDPVNPFTNQKLQTRKADGANVATIGALSSYRHTEYKYNIENGNWLHVHTNIFDPANWKRPR